jgi:hypothetical protein
MMSKPFLAAVTVARPRKVLLALFLTSALVSACGVRSGGPETVGTLAATQETETQPTGTATGLPQVVNNEPLDYCFAFPQGFTQQANDSQVEVVGPHSATGPQPGLLWIDATEAHGRTAQDVAHEEVAAFGGSPARSTVILGGEEALVLDGMPGQDPIRKIYIVHEGLLYTLSFSPDSSDNATANAQMETLLDSVTSSWVWTSSGAQCPLVN